MITHVHENGVHVHIFNVEYNLLCSLKMQAERPCFFSVSWDQKLERKKNWIKLGMT